MKKIKKAIEEYESKKGEKYERILISESFYNKLHEESAMKGNNSPIKQVRSTIMDIRGMEVVEGENFDFKLLP